MYATFASGTLIVIGVLLAVLGVLSAGNMVMVVIGLVSILAGGLLGVADRRRAS